MSDKQLELIRQYCDTSGVRLSQSEKDILCKVLESPSRYDGFTTRLFEERDSGRDYNDTWNTKTEWQYRINIDSSLSIDKSYRHSCDDGYVNDSNWGWQNAWHITEIRRLLEVLFEIESEL